MKKTLFLFSLILLVAGCAGTKVKSFKAVPMDGKKTVLEEKIVEEVTDSLIGERIKKSIVRTAVTSSAITLSEQNSYEDENFKINFKFNSNNIDLTINNKREVDASFLADYSYYTSYDATKYKLFLLDSWKDNKKIIKSQVSPVIPKVTSTTINLTPEICIDSSIGSGTDNYQYWQRGTLASNTIGKKAVNDYVEILIPIKCESNVYSYLFKVKLTPEK